MNNDNIKILHIINGMGSGGAEKVIMNWYRNINREKYQFDFLIRSNQIFYKEEIVHKGGCIYQVAPFPRAAIKNIIETYRFLKENRKVYSVIHVHSNSLVYIIPLVIARFIGIKKRIIHIHSTKASGKLATLIHCVNKKIIKFLATDMVACSHEAGVFAFGNDKFVELKNGIDIGEFDVDKKLVDKSYIFGHVGRFLPVKNQKFVVDIFKELHNENRHYMLMLVGGGPLINEVKTYARNIGLEKNIIFLGERHDVSKLLQKIDFVIFPSKYEGVPLVVLEAQAAGKKVLMSDVITDDVMVTPLVEKESLNNSARDWCTHINKMLKKNIDCDIKNEFKKRKLDMGSTVSKLIKIYGDERL